MTTLTNEVTTFSLFKVVGDNEFEPIWDTPVPDSSEMFTGVSISETDAPGTLIETFSATDQDGGVDGDVTYDIISITSGIVDSCFHVVENVLI